MILYGIPNCGTVKKARAWLETHGVAYAFHDFKKQGVPVAELQRMMAAHGWEALLNRRGPTWRKLDPTVQASVKNAASALAVMQESPSVIKRPILVEADREVIGFDEIGYTQFTQPSQFIQS